MKTIITKRKVVTLAIIITSVFIPCEACAQVPQNSNGVLGAEALIKANTTQAYKTATASESINNCGKCGAPLLFNAPEDTWYCSRCGQRYPVKHRCTSSCVITPEQYIRGQEGCVLVKREKIPGKPNQERVTITNISKHHITIPCTFCEHCDTLGPGEFVTIVERTGCEVDIRLNQSCPKQRPTQGKQSQPRSTTRTRPTQGQQTRTRPTQGQQTRPGPTQGQQTRTQQKPTQGQQTRTR